MPRESIRFFAGTDVGKVRDHNEDNYLVDKKLNLFIVADGMGGHAAGEVASGMAVRTVRDAVAKNRDMIDQFDQGDASITRRDVLNILEFAVQQACHAVHTVSEAEPEKRGMGTTLTALLVAGERGFIAHVGDSRIYMLRDGRVHLLTDDHSVINELIKRGRLKKEDAESSPYKNAVTRAVGVFESVEVDTLDFEVLPGDRFLLASDGLHGYLQEAEIPKLIEQAETDEDPTGGLIEIANRRGGKDNITSVVVALDAGEETRAKKIAQDVNLRMEILHKMPIFRFLGYQELVRVMNMTEVRNFKAGDPVIVEGAEGEELFIVLAGKVRVHHGDAVLTTLGAGEHVGEMALVDKTPRSASVTADEDSRLLSVHRKDFFQLLRKEQAIAVKLLWSFLQVLTDRLRTTSRQLGDAKVALTAEDLTQDIFDLDAEGGSA